MKNWPPRLWIAWQGTRGEMLIDSKRVVGMTDYRLTLRSELANAVPNFGQLTETDQNTLWSEVLTLDIIADDASRVIDGSPWKTTLERTEPPPEAKTQSQQNKWRGHRERALCVAEARSAREALFRGNLIQFSSHAMNATNHARGEHALSGAKSHAASKKPNRAPKKSAKIVEKTVFNEVEQNPLLENGELADKIHMQHPKKQGYSRPNVSRILKKPRVPSE